MTDVTVTAASAAAPSSGPARSPWHDPGGFGFRDILDIVNPLQHLPIVSSIYRWLTGDRPGEAAQIAGDALYGGPIGVAVSLVGAMTEDKDGHDLGEQALVAMFGSGDRGTTLVADATLPAGPSSAAAGPAPAKAAPPQADAVPAPPRAQTSPVLLDHPPMPLYRKSGPASATANPAQDPARAFLDHNAALQRQIGAGTGAHTNAIPLVPPAGSLPAGHFVSPAPAPPVSTAPLDISQKMLDALDKYMRLEKERKAGETAPKVDLAL